MMITVVVNEILDAGVKSSYSADLTNKSYVYIMIRIVTLKFRETHKYTCIFPKV